LNIVTAKSRINEVLKVDSINNSHSDFLATHVPFRNISVSTNNNGRQTESHGSEEELFYEIFEDESARNKHQLVIVEGSSGVGKSHFIRWINAKLAMRDDDTDVVRLIRRSDNTLKGTIKQLLEIDEIKSLERRDVYERLVKADQTIGEQKFKSTIYHRFIIEIENEERETTEELYIPRTNQRKNLIALMNNSLFAEKMTENGGPIDRIYRKISNDGNTAALDVNARFEIEDLCLSVDFTEEIEESGADRNAIKMADKLIPQEDGDDSFIRTIVDYLNSFVETVIRASAGIESGDFQQIFKEIRQALKKSGKNLILLIEDITSFTGINQELLSALITDHTGMNEEYEMCRLISVVGTTSEYYREFRNNYKDRVTKKITINDGVIGDYEDDLVQFVAKYLNAISVDSNELRDWVIGGAVSDDMPVHSDARADVWGYYELKGKKLSLFPFNRTAVVKLYNAMPSHKTPRYILQDIVSGAVNEIIYSKDIFPRFCSDWRYKLPESVESRISNIVSSLDIEEKSNFRSRLLSFIGFWGNGSIDLTDDDRIGGIDLQIYSELGFGVFADYIKQNTAVKKSSVHEESVRSVTKTDEPGSADQVAIDPEIEKRQREYESFKKNVVAWHHDKGKLLSFQPVRDAVCDFVFQSINWQQEGVPFSCVRKVKDSSLRLVAFERQEIGQDKALMVLEDNEETYRLLLCFAKWKYLGKNSWTFTDSASAVFVATSWLEKNKSAFVRLMRGGDENEIPEYISAAAVIQIVKRILNGKFEGSSLTRVQSPQFLDADQKKSSTAANSQGHSTEWKQLIELIYNDSKACEDSYREFINYFNIVQGDSGQSKIFVLNSTLFDRFLKVIHKLKLQEITDSADEKIKGKKDILEFYNKIVQRLERTAESESRRGKEMFDAVYPYFGFEEDDEIESSDIKNIINEINNFYNKCAAAGINLSVGENDAAIREKVKNNSKRIASALLKLQENYCDTEPIDILAAYTSDPIDTVAVLGQILVQAESDVSKVISQMENELELQKGKGLWNSETDPRFDEQRESFFALCKEYEEVE